jgi:Zn-dependent peptidase ImmA (M78 family)/DNA-binding XRE family transcriptional regulator
VRIDKLDELSYFVNANHFPKYNTMTNSIFAERLKAARKMAGFSLQDLEDKIDAAVTKQALHQYEKGVMMPDSSVMILLAKATGVRTDYFFRTATVNLESLAFRKGAALGVKAKESIKQKAVDFVERYLELESILAINSNFQSPFKNRVIRLATDIEQAATDLRSHWHLGNDPIPDVVEMLESKAVKVFELETDEKFDGLSAKAGNVSVIVLNKKRDVVRLRFTALHELAHLILEFHKDAGDEEKLSHAFAGAVLLPKEALYKSLGKSRMQFTLEELVRVKESYGISIAAIMARAKSLGVISEATHKSFSIYWSKEGYRIKEPGTYPSREKATRFDQLLSRAVAEEMITMSKAASLADRSISQLENQFTLI